VYTCHNASEAGMKRETGCGACTVFEFWFLSEVSSVCTVQLRPSMLLLLHLGPTRIIIISACPPPRIANHFLNYRSVALAACNKLAHNTRARRCLHSRA
jgi:hypothetical protein